MKKVTAVLSSLCLLYMMSLPVLADVIADPVPAKEETNLLPIFFIIGVAVIAAVVLIILLRRKK